MKQTLYRILILGLAIFWSWWGCGEREDVVKIGVILPLTGDMAAHGEDAKKSIDLATWLKNNEGGIQGKKIKIIFEDDNMQPQQGVTAFRKLSKVDQVEVVLGGMGSSVALAIAPIAEKEKVVMISPTASNPKLTQSGKYIFRNWPSDTYEGNIMAEFAFKHLKKEKSAILYVNNDMGLGLRNIYSKKFKELGGDIVIEQDYEQGNTDFRTILFNIKESEPEIIYLSGYYGDLAKIIKQAVELNINSQFLSSTTVEHPKFIELTGSLAEGLIYARPAFDTQNPTEPYKKFASLFKERYGIEPGIAATQCFDAINIIFSSIENGGNDGEGIRKAMEKIKNYNGVTGLTSFDENGDVIKEFSIFHIKNRQFVKYK